MIVWINGAFGAGKTSVARRIVERRPGAMLFDPEQIGFLLRRLLPRADVADFQDLPLWRELTGRLIAEAAAGAAGPIVVPMTIARKDSLDEIVGGLRRRGLEVRHFTLVVRAETLRRRLWRRLDWPASRRWAMARVEGCVEALADQVFAEHVETEGLSVAQVAQRVLDALDSSTSRACA
jgi:hypothetical protein